MATVAIINSNELNIILNIIIIILMIIIARFVDKKNVLLAIDYLSIFIFMLSFGVDIYFLANHTDKVSTDFFILCGVFYFRLLKIFSQIVKSLNKKSWKKNEPVLVGFKKLEND